MQLTNDSAEQSRVIVCLNSGSSSLKMALYRSGGDSEELIASGTAERVGQADGRLRVTTGKEETVLDQHRLFSSHEEVLETLFKEPAIRNLPRPDAVGHRVVHGGPDFWLHQSVRPELIARLKELIPLAPLHLPSSIAVMEFVTRVAPDLPQVVCFDTAFHHDMPELAKRLPLARSLWHEGIRKYGFHGLSYEYIVSQLGEQVRGATVIAHLGNGASMAALRDGKPIDTTMGLTPDGGLMMGTRSGDLDPGLLLYLMRTKAKDVDVLSRLVEKEAGLLGVSETSGDMKNLLENASTDPRAEQAVQMFCYTARKYIGAMAAALGGLDLLVFTGGIGERAAPVRERICRELSFLGADLDEQKNLQGSDVISREGARCTVRVIPTSEDRMIVRHTSNVIRGL